MDAKLLAKDTMTEGLPRKLFSVGGITLDSLKSAMIVAGELARREMSIMHAPYQDFRIMEWGSD